METIKKVSHTKGPWEIRYGSGIDMRIIAQDFGLVAEINGPTTVAAMAEYEAEFTANAKLIAASPSLLEALMECQEYFSVMAGENHVASRKARELTKEAIKLATE